MPKDNQVICGSCENTYANKQAYLAHTCEATGYQPTNPRHLGTNFLRQSKRALERTGSLTPEREQEIDSMISQAKNEDVHNKVQRYKIDKKRANRIKAKEVRK